MLSFKEYQTNIADPAIESLLKFAKECQEVKKNISMADYYPNTPLVLEHEKPKDKVNGGTAEIIEFYNLPIGNFRSEYYEMEVIDAILMFLDDLQETLKLKKEFASIKNFKNYVLSLDRNPKIISYKEWNYDRDTIRENGASFGKFRSYFTAIKNDILAIKPEDISIVEPSIVEPPVVEPSIVQPSSQELDIEIKNSGITSNFVSNMTLENVVRYKNALVGATKLIRSSEIQQFKKVLLDAKFVIGTLSDIYDKTGFKYTGKASAHYLPHLDSITYYTDKKGVALNDDKDPTPTMIHELAHRFHYHFIVNNFDNKMIISLWREAKASKKQCYLKHLPKIGDSLNNFRYPYYTVGSISNEYILTNIDKEKNLYTYTDSENNIQEFTLKEILHLISCPSTYGAKNPVEFFAEMCTLITLNLVKPNQRELADKFINIINQNLKG